MRQYLWPIIVIALALLAAGAWVCFPEERKAVGPAVTSFCNSFADEAKRAWARLFPATEAPEVPDPVPFGDGNVAVSHGAASANSATPVPTELGAIADPASDPEPSSLTREQRKRRYQELVAAADKRKREVLLACLSKCPEGIEALNATRAYHAKVDEMKKLEDKQGQTDDNVALLRIELVHLKEALNIANARYKAWKDAHPEEVVDPMSDQLYCDLVARSRFYKD